MGDAPQKVRRTVDYPAGAANVPAVRRSFPDSAGELEKRGVDRAWHFPKCHAHPEQLSPNSEFASTIFPRTTHLLRHQPRYIYYFGLVLYRFEGKTTPGGECDKPTLSRLCQPASSHSLDDRSLVELIYQRICDCTGPACMSARSAIGHAFHSSTIPTSRSTAASKTTRPFSALALVASPWMPISVQRPQ